MFIKLFNKLIPLIDGELNLSIQQLCNKVNYPIYNIFIIDSSKQSKQVGAFITGFGVKRSIVIYDTLVERFEPDETLAVVAHEIGHAKYSHVVKYYFMFLVKLSLVIPMFYFMLEQPIISKSFGFEIINIAFVYHLICIIVPSISKFFDIPINAIKRQCEHNADLYAKNNHNAQSVVNALKKTARENYINLTPHSFLVMVEYDHPPIDKRISALGDDFKSLPSAE
jgi:STE24 endopeptidase